MRTEIIGSISKSNGSHKSLWTESEHGADFGWVEVLLDEQGDDDGQLLVDEVPAVVLDAGQEVADPDHHFLDLETQTSSLVHLLLVSQS